MDGFVPRMKCGNGGGNGMYKGRYNLPVQLIRGLKKLTLHAVHQTTRIFDAVYLKKSTEMSYPPVFIVGAPRSGTTLFYQLLIQNFRTAYFPNIANSFYMCPISATRFGLLFCKEYQSSFKSKFGYEKGCMAPSEAGNIWNRWFPHEGKEGFNYTPAGYIKEPDRKIIYRIVANIEQLFRAPFFTKNVKMSVRLPALSEIFPNALFLFLRREPLHAAVSLLRIRRQHNLSWWSVMPKEIDRIKDLPDIEQVCHQVYYVEQNILQDARAYFPDQIYTLNYQTLCNQPQKELDNIYHFLNERGCHLQSKKVNTIQKFNISLPGADRWVSEKEIQRMKNILKNLYQN